MGRDKALLEISGVPLLLRTAHLLQSFLPGVTVVGPPQRYASLGLRVIPDDFVDVGPLGGLATALRHSTSEWNLVAGCDLPFLSAPFLHWLIARALTSPCDVLVPQDSRGPEPLCAVYRRTCAAPLTAAIASGTRKITDALSGLAVQHLAESEWPAMHLGDILFKNMNTPADYDEARSTLERET